MLRFRNPDSFVAGKLSACVPQWRSVLENYTKKEEIPPYITDDVSVFDFFTPFQGSFQGKKNCSDIPPEAIFPNSSSCGPFSDFISKTIMDRVINAYLRIMGMVGSCRPPQWILLITIEPCKPRMCHDERFLKVSGYVLDPYVFEPQQHARFTIFYQESIHFLNAE